MNRSSHPLITEEAVVEFVTHVGGVTFVELTGHFGSDAVGTRVITLHNDPNLVLWMNVSLALETAITGAINHKRIYAFPTTPLLYLMDGQFCTLPIAKTIKPFYYRTPHWIPVEFNTWKHLTSAQRQVVRDSRQ